MKSERERCARIVEAFAGVPRREIVAAIRNPQTFWTKEESHAGMDYLHRVVTGQTVTPTELRVAGAFVIGWFLMDCAWFLGSLNHWWGL